MNHFSLTDVHCFDGGYVEKQPASWKEYCAEYWLKELQDITEITLKTVLKPYNEDTYTKFSFKLKHFRVDILNFLSN